jgi:hypothetical protein
VFRLEQKACVTGSFITMWKSLVYVTETF